MLRVPHLYHEDSTTACLKWWLWGLNNFTYIRHLKVYLVHCEQSVQLTFILPTAEHTNISFQIAGRRTCDNLKGPSRILDTGKGSDLLVPFSGLGGRSFWWAYNADSLRGAVLFTAATYWGKMWPSLFQIPWCGYVESAMIRLWGKKHGISFRQLWKRLKGILHVLTWSRPAGRVLKISHTKEYSVCRVGLCSLPWFSVAV